MAKMHLLVAGHSTGDMFEPGRQHISLVGFPDRGPSAMFVRIAITTIIFFDSKLPSR